MVLAVKPISYGGRLATGIDVIGTMKVQGKKQGLIGSSASGAANGWTSLASYTQEKKTVIVTRPVDAASPKFSQALNTNEELTLVVLQLLKKVANGKQVPDRIVRLTGVVISKIRRDGPDLTRNGVHLEEVSFTFQAIQIQNASASTSTTDDWTAQNQ